MSEVGVHVLAASDAVEARALVRAQFAATRYCDRILEQLESALTVQDPEYSALVAVSSGEEQVTGLVLFGDVAGALDVVKIYVIAGTDSGSLRALVDAVSARSSECRMLVCELPDDGPYLRMADVLASAGFAEAGRVADLFSDGVALRILATLVHTPRAP